MLEQHPQSFRLSETQGRLKLHCALTKETLSLDRELHLLDTVAEHPLTPAYQDTLDALACQLQEDLAVVSLDEHGNDYVAALHLCLPNHWAAEDKIGKGFIASHAPVPEMEQINKSAAQLLNVMVNKGPFVRFAWGLATDTRLNHHPEAPPGQDEASWHGRRFDPARPELYLRVERQTIHGFPQINASLFTIRSYFYDVSQLAKQPQQREALYSAIQSMSGESLQYKGLLQDKAAILEWLDTIKL